MLTALGSFTNASEIVMTYDVFKEAEVDAIVKTIGEQAARRLRDAKNRKQREYRRKKKAKA